MCCDPRTPATVAAPTSPGIHRPAIGPLREVSRARHRLLGGEGRSGTTVVTATLALSCPTESLLVDLDGELPAVLGIAAPTGQGVADWLASDAPAQRARRPRRRRRPHDAADPTRVRRRPGVAALARARRLARPRDQRLRRRGHRRPTTRRPRRTTSAASSSPGPATSRCGGRAPRRAGRTASCSSPSHGAACVRPTSSAPSAPRSSRRSATIPPSPAPSMPACWRPRCSPRAAPARELRRVGAA